MNSCLHDVYGSIGVVTGLLQSGNATGMHIDFAATREERLHCYLEDRWHEGRGEGHKGGGGAGKENDSFWFEPVQTSVCRS